MDCWYITTIRRPSHGIIYSIEQRLFWEANSNHHCWRRAPMEFGHSLPCPQQPDPEPDKSSRHPHSLVPEDTFYYYSPIYTYFSHVGSSPYALQIKYLLAFRFLWPCIVSKAWREKNQQDATIRCLLITSISTCFGDHYAHLQKNKEPVTGFGVLF
jgi:hypothetical protein